MFTCSTNASLRHVLCYGSLTATVQTVFGLSFAERGELLDYIKKVGSFDEHSTQFYTAEIIVALEYLHGKGIIHR